MSAPCCGRISLRTDPWGHSSGTSPAMTSPWGGGVSTVTPRTLVVGSMGTGGPERETEGEAVYSPCAGWCQGEGSLGGSNLNICIRVLVSRPSSWGDRLVIAWVLGIIVRPSAWEVMLTPGISVIGRLTL